MPLDPFTALGAGAGLGILGGIFGASAASKRKKALTRLAGTPGVDVGGAYSDTINAGLANLPGAQQFAGAQNTFNLAELNRLYESSIPGFQKAQASRIGAVAPLLEGKIPEDVAREVFRRSAVSSVGGGFGGSPAARNLSARDLGLTSLDLISRGNQLFGGILGSTPMPNMVGTSDILNVSGSDVLGLRSKERSEALDLLAKAAGAPGAGDIAGKALGDVGGIGLGFGLLNLFGG